MYNHSTRMSKQERTMWLIEKNIQYHTLTSQDGAATTYWMSPRHKLLVSEGYTVNGACSGQWVVLPPGETLPPNVSEQ